MEVHEEKRVRKVIIFTVGAVWKAAYELYAHSAVARHVGISDEAVAALTEGAPPNDLSPAEKTAHRFVKRLCSHYCVDDDLYHEAERIFGAEGITDMIQLLAILNGFQVPVPDGRE